MAQPTIDRKLEQAGDRVRDAAGDAAERGWSGIHDLLAAQPLQAFGIPVSVGGVIAAVVAILVAMAISAVVHRALRRYGQRNASADKAALYTVSRLLHYLLLVIGVLVAFDLAGVPMGKLAVFAGAIGVGLGFGLQAIFSNFISGVILLFDRSLKVGDFIELEGDIRGTVRSIDIRAACITTNDNIDVLVPNSEFITKRVINWTHESVNRRMRVPFEAAYGADKERVKKAALEAAARVPFTLAIEGDKRPQVWLTGFGDNAMEYALVVWLTSEAARVDASVKAAYLWELDTALKAHGIEIPYPQRDLHLRSAFGLSGAEAIAALRGDAAAVSEPDPSKTLPPGELAALAQNDAQADTERVIEEEAARAAAAARPPDPTSR